MTRWLTIVGCAVALAAAGCSKSPAIEGIAERYVRVTLQLAQHDPSLVEQWRGPESWRPGPRRPVVGLLDTIQQIQQDIDIRQLDVSSSSEYSRLRYLEGQTQALRFAAERLLGRSAGIDDQLREEFGLTPALPDAPRMAGVRNRIDKALPGTGTLWNRVAALKKRTQVSPDRAEAVLGLAIDACRQATRAAIDLPSGEAVTLGFGTNLDWDGFAEYEGHNRTAISISLEAPLDVSRALRLACHEGYPGHHVQNVLLDRGQQQLKWPELELTPGFGRHLLLAEGAAEIGADLALSHEARVRVYRDTLLPAAGLSPDEAATLARVDALLPELLPEVTDIARRYLDGAIQRQQAVDELRERALVLNPEGTLALIERRRGRALAYAEGRRFLSGLLKTPGLSALQSVIADGTALQ